MRAVRTSSYILIGILAIAGWQTHLYATESIRNINRTSWLHDTCRSDLASAKGDVQIFINSHCGSYVMGFMDGNYITMNVLLHNFGKAAKGKNVIFPEEKRALYCSESEVSPIDAAKLLVGYIEKTKYHDSVTALANALAEKYPCVQSETEDER